MPPGLRQSFRCALTADEPQADRLQSSRTTATMAESQPDADGFVMPGNRRQALFGACLFIVLYGVLRIADVLSLDPLITGAIAAAMAVAVWFVVRPNR